MKKIGLISGLCLLVISIGLNLFYLFDYYPKPIATNALNWNDEYSYTLAYPDSGASSIIVSMDENYKPQQYVEFDDVYNQILMTSEGIIISNETDSVVLKNDNGVLIEDVQAKQYNLESFITSDLLIGAGGELQVQKEVSASGVKDQELQTEVEYDYNIYQVYPLEYDEAFVIDGINYLPHDFDSLTLKKI